MKPQEVLNVLYNVLHRLSFCPANQDDVIDIQYGCMQYSKLYSLDYQ